MAWDSGTRHRPMDRRSSHDGDVTRTDAILRVHPVEARKVFKRLTRKADCTSERYGSRSGISILAHNTPHSTRHGTRRRRTIKKRPSNSATASPTQRRRHSVADTRAWQRRAIEPKGGEVSAEDAHRWPGKHSSLPIAPRIDRSHAKAPVTSTSPPARPHHFVDIPRQILDVSGKPKVRRRQPCRFASWRRRKVKEPRACAPHSADPAILALGCERTYRCHLRPADASVPRTSPERRAFDGVVVGVRRRHRGCAQPPAAAASLTPAVMGRQLRSATMMRRPPSAIALQTADVRSRRSTGVVFALRT